MMKQVITILATVLLASSLLTGAAEARGGGGFGGAAHIGGLGGVHMGGPAAAGLGRVNDGHIGLGDYRSGVHNHAIQRFGRRYDSYVPGCVYPDEASKLPPWPPFCS